MVTITALLSDEEAQALAQFLKRVGFSEWRQNAVDDEEGYSCPSRQKGKISLEMALLPLEVPCSKRLDLQIERPRH